MQVLHYITNCHNCPESDAMQMAVQMLLSPYDIALHNSPTPLPQTDAILLSGYNIMGTPHRDIMLSTADHIRGVWDMLSRHVPVFALGASGMQVKSERERRTIVGDWDGIYIKQAYLQHAEDNLEQEAAIMKITGDPVTQLPSRGTPEKNSIGIHIHRNRGNYKVWHDDYIHDILIPRTVRAMQHEGYAVTFFCDRTEDLQYAYMMSEKCQGLFHSNIRSHHDISSFIVKRSGVISRSRYIDSVCTSAGVPCVRLNDNDSTAPGIESHSGLNTLSLSVLIESLKSATPATPHHQMTQAVQMLATEIQALRVAK